MESLTDSSFEEKVLKASGPALVDFGLNGVVHAKCSLLFWRNSLKENEGKIQIFKVNVDECQQLAVQFNIRSIPTLLFSRTVRCRSRWLASRASPIFGQASTDLPKVPPLVLLLQKPINVGNGSLTCSTNVGLTQS